MPESPEDTRPEENREAQGSEEKEIDYKALGQRVGKEYAKYDAKQVPPQNLPAAYRNREWKLLDHRKIDGVEGVNGIVLSEKGELGLVRVERGQKVRIVLASEPGFKLEDFGYDKNSFIEGLKPGRKKEEKVEEKVLSEEEKSAEGREEEQENPEEAKEVKGEEVEEEELVVEEAEDEIVLEEGAVDTRKGADLRIDKRIHPRNPKNYRIVKYRRLGPKKTLAFAELFGLDLAQELYESYKAGNLANPGVVAKIREDYGEEVAAVAEEGLSGIMKLARRGGAIDGQVFARAINESDDKVLHDIGKSLGKDEIDWRVGANSKLVEIYRESYVQSISLHYAGMPERKKDRDEVKEESAGTTGERVEGRETTSEERKKDPTVTAEVVTGRTTVRISKLRDGLEKLLGNGELTEDFDAQILDIVDSSSKRALYAPEGLMGAMDTAEHRALAYAEEMEIPETSRGKFVEGVKFIVKNHMQEMERVVEMDMKEEALEGEAAGRAAVVYTWLENNGVEVDRDVFETAIMEISKELVEVRQDGPREVDEYDAVVQEKVGGLLVPRGKIALPDNMKKKFIQAAGILVKEETQKIIEGEQLDDTKMETPQTEAETRDTEEEEVGPIEKMPFGKGIMRVLKRAEKREERMQKVPEGSEELETPERGKRAHTDTEPETITVGSGRKR